MSSAVMSGAEGVPERYTLGSRTMSQGLFGGIAVVLGIVGLAIELAHPTVSMYLAAIAEIALGLSLIVVGTSLAAAYARLLARAEPTAGAAGGYMAGTTVDMFLGGAIVILAILAILKVASPVLIPIAVIVVGVGLFLNSLASIRLANLESTMVPATVARRVVEEMVLATASVRAIGGIAVFVLGIIGLLGTVTMPLALVAMIVAGVVLVLNSTSLSGRFVSSMTR